MSTAREVFLTVRAGLRLLLCCFVTLEGTVGIRLKSLCTQSLDFFCS